MRVVVSSASDVVGSPIRAYAECRLFAVLAQYPSVQGAQVRLRRDPRGMMRCSILIKFTAAGSATAHTIGPNAAATIDRAAGRVVRLMRRRRQRDAVGA
jgi:hypothetical protein